MAKAKTKKRTRAKVLVQTHKKSVDRRRPSSIVQGGRADLPPRKASEMNTSTSRMEADVMQYFDGALNAFGDAMKSGVKAQEDMVKWWSNALNGGGPLTDWQKRSRAMLDEAVPAAQRNAEEWMKTVEQNYRRSMELFRKAVDQDQSGAVSNLRERTHKLWEESLSVVKENTEAMVQANVRMMELWTDMVRRNVEQGEAAFRSATAATAAAAK